MRVSAPTVCGDLLDMVERNNGKKARGFISLQFLVSHGTSSNLHFVLLRWSQKESLVWVSHIKKQLVTFNMLQS